MSTTVYVCPRWETFGIEELKDAEIGTTRKGKKAFGKLETPGKRDDTRTFKEGHFFTELNNAINYANKLKMKKEENAKKLPLRGYFSDTVLKLPEAPSDVEDVNNNSEGNESYKVRM